MRPDRLIHEYRHPGGVIEQRLLCRDAAEFCGYKPRDRRIRAELEHLRWTGPVVVRVNGVPSKVWRRFTMVVEP